MMKSKKNRKYVRISILATALFIMSSVGTAIASEMNVPSAVISEFVTQNAEQNLLKDKTAFVNWISRDGKWYGYDFDGNLLHGWVQDRGLYYYLDVEGVCLTNQMTPDGYYVDVNGAWYQRSTELFSNSFKASEKFPSVTSFWTNEKAVKGMQKKIDQIFDTRRIRITDTSMEYLCGTSKEETLIGIYKNSENGSYRIDLRVNLDKASTRENLAATYDYQVFKAFLYQITSTPELMEDAVYSSWEGDNRWNISRTEYRTVGDSLVKYTAGNGYGCYNIFPATQ